MCNNPRFSTTYSQNNKLNFKKTYYEDKGIQSDYSG